jgi:hypothetical protein
MPKWWKQFLSRDTSVNYDRAADKLFEIGQQKHWWGAKVPHWRKFDEPDRLEFRHAAEQITRAGLQL